MHMGDNKLNHTGIPLLRVILEGGSDQYTVKH